MLRFAISFSSSNFYSETLHDNLPVARAKRSIDEENQNFLVNQRDGFRPLLELVW